MKRQKRLIAAIIALNMISAIFAVPTITKAADNNFDIASNLVNQALSEKSFYHYNVAYDKITKLPEGAEKQKLLANLSTIANTVWSKDISELVGLIEIMAKEKSGREYDILEARIEKTSIKEIDKHYLYSELYSWGRDTVWTDDYKKAVAAVIKVWNDKTETASAEAEKAVKEMKLEANKTYLTELLSEAKIAIGIAPVTLDPKYFNTVSSLYVGDGKKVSLDLSGDTTERTVILKGKIQALDINAPLATIVLEDAEVNEIKLSDIANHSLYLKGSTKVESLVINDLSDNAHVVLQGKATVTVAEVKSAAIIEVNTDSDIQKPFGTLKINTEEKKTIDLSGDFKASAVQIQKPAVLKVAAVIEKIASEEASVGSIITLTKEGKLAELNAEAAIKVEGAGTLGKTTGSAAISVSNTITIAPVTGTGGGTSGGSKTPNNSGNNGGTTQPTKEYTIDDIIESVQNSLSSANINARVEGNNIMFSKKGDGPIGEIKIVSPVEVEVNIIAYVFLVQPFGIITEVSEPVGRNYEQFKEYVEKAKPILELKYKGTTYSYTMVCE